MSAPATRRVAPRRDAKDGDNSPTRRRKRGSSRSATPISRATARSACQGNRDLFLNTINWLAQQENLIAIRPRDPEDRRITLTADQERRIFYLTVLIVPGLILLAGVQTWWRRR